MSSKILKWLGIGACVLLGALIGYLIWCLVKQLMKGSTGNQGGVNDGTLVEPQKTVNWGAWIGLVLAVVYFVIKQINTVNYILYNHGVRVYDGITKHNRLARRIREHRRSGKVFDRYRSSRPTFRFIARDVERQRIKVFRPRYNVQYNCKS